MRMLAVSFISTMKVDWPRARLSLAPTRVKSRSTAPIEASAAGTNAPICARTTQSPICRRMVDLPAIFGPVTRRTRSASVKEELLGELARIQARQRDTVAHIDASDDQLKRVETMFKQLEQWLAEITGFAATSLQPNAGSQGEYAGLLVIRAYHDARGDSHRDVCLIPHSAHGTNPASAVMAVG